MFTKLLLISYLLVRKVSTVIYEPTSATTTNSENLNNNDNDINQNYNQFNNVNDNPNRRTQYYYHPQSSHQMVHKKVHNSRPTARHMLTEVIYHPPMKPLFPSIDSVSRSYLTPNHERVDPWPSPWPSPPHEEDHDELEKTFLHYIFPTILVIGLGSLIIPIIAVFFIAFTYTNSGGCIKSKNKSLIDKRRPHLIPNILDLLVAVEKAFSRGEANYKTKLKKLIPKNRRESRSYSSSSSSSSKTNNYSFQHKHHYKLLHTKSM